MKFLNIISFVSFVVLFTYCANTTNTLLIKPADNQKLSPEECAACKQTGSGAPVLPNKSKVTGIVLTYEKAESTLENIVLYTINISIESVQEISGRTNLLKGKEGQEIKCYTKEELSWEITNKKIEAEASFRGDEHGGNWWLNNIKIFE